MPKFRTCYHKYIIAHRVFTARAPIRASQVSPTSSRSSAIMTAVDATLWLIPAFLSNSGVPLSRICVSGHCACCLCWRVPVPCVIPAPWSCCPSVAVACLMLSQFMAISGQVPEAVAVVVDPSCAALWWFLFITRSSHLPGHRFLPQVMYSVNVFFCKLVMNLSLQVWPVIIVISCLVVYWIYCQWAQ